VALGWRLPCIVELQHTFGDELAVEAVAMK